MFTLSWTRGSASLPHVSWCVACILSALTPQTRCLVQCMEFSSTVGLQNHLCTLAVCVDRENTVCSTEICLCDLQGCVQGLDTLGGQNLTPQPSARGHLRDRILCKRPSERPNPLQMLWRCFSGGDSLFLVTGTYVTLRLG